MQATLPDIRFAARSLTQAGELIFQVEDRATVLINATAVSSGTYKVYGSMNYGDPGATAQWIGLHTIDSTGTEVAAGSTVTPTTAKTVYASCAGYTHIRIVEQNAGTATIQLSASAMPIGDVIGFAGTVQTSHGKTLKTVTGTISATTDVVTAVTGKRIKVTYYKLTTGSTTANTIKAQSGASTDLDVTILQATSGTIAGMVASTAAPSFLFATVAGEKLTLNFSASASTSYVITYFDDDAS